jgi:hypothetical protein
LTITKPASSGNVTIDGSVSVSGVVTLSNANSNLVVGSTGNVTLLSNASGSASIASIPSGASVNGNVTVQRYLNGTGDGWFLLGGTTVGANLAQWADDMYLAAGTSLGGTQGVMPVGIQHSTIFRYDESNHNVSLDTVQKRGWRVPLAGEDLGSGKGFRVYLTSYNTSTRTIENVGTVHQGNFNYPSITRNEFTDCQPNSSPATVPCTEENRGWNLLANPYPSSVNWDAASGWTKPGGMLNGFYRWNSASNGYGVYTGGSYVGAGPAPANPNLIPSGQGFFVKLQSGASAALSMNENAKVNTQATFLRTATSATSALKMEMRSASNSASSYLAELRFAEGAADGMDAQLDAPYFPSAGFSFAMPVGNEQLILNTMAPLSETRIIPMNVNAAAGSYVFNFSGIQSFPAQTSVLIRDNVYGIAQDIRTQPQFAFSMNAGESASGRFELIVSPEIVTASSLTRSAGALKVYPNPVNGSEVTVELTGNSSASAVIQLTDLLGKLAFIRNAELSNGKFVINTSGLAKGVYNLKVRSGAGSWNQRVVIQ